MPLLALPTLVGQVQEMSALQYFLYTVFGLLMLVAAVFLILLILIQRGKGGGLSGAFGGMGGQSALGTKAGDTLTWVTVYSTAGWIFLCVLAVVLLRPSDDGEQIRGVGGATPAITDTPTGDGDDAE